MTIKAPNGYGNISKLSGNRRRPFWVRITTGWEINEETGKAKQLTSTLGYYASRKEAMIALAEYHQNPIDLTRKTLTFAEVWDIWTPPHFKKYPSSAAGLRSAYKRCAPLYDMQMADIKKVHMQDILDGMNHMSEESQGKEKSIFKNAFKYCIENDIVTKDYSQFLVITPPKKKKAAKEKFFTAEELGAVFGSQDFAVQFPTGKKSYAELQLADTVLIMLYTGMRIGELLGVKTEDVDLAQRIIHVRGTKTENADRIVPIHRELAPILSKRLDGEHLIENANGKPIKYDQYKKHFFDPYMESLGVSHTPHALRHTFVSLMDSCGVSSNSVVLKRIVGHSNSNVTELYTHKDVTDLIDAIDKLQVNVV